MARKPAIEIHEMLVENIPAVVELGNALFTAEKAPTLYRCWEEAEVLRIYSSYKETCLVAIMGDKVVGFALGSLLAKPGSSWKYGWLDWLGIAPSCNRRRVAQRLVRQLQERFVSQEVRIMLVDTYEGNSPALGFFRKFGFGQEIRHVYMSMNLDSHPKAIERIYGND
jgi:ribosomal protein S18 acetylase RimI-like enzyme